MKTYSTGIILALIFLALCTTTAYLLGLKDGLLGLEDTEVQNENVILELTMTGMYSLRLKKPGVKNGSMICVLIRAKASYAHALQTLEARIIYNQHE